MICFGILILSLFCGCGFSSFIWYVFFDEDWNEFENEIFVNEDYNDYGYCGVEFCIVYVGIVVIWGVGWWCFIIYWSICIWIWYCFYWF